MLTSSKNNSFEIIKSHFRTVDNTEWSFKTFPDIWTTSGLLTHPVESGKNGNADGLSTLVSTENIRRDHLTDS